jgi:hypothetical protein
MPLASKTIVLYRPALKYGTHRSSQTVHYSKAAMAPAAAARPTALPTYCSTRPVGAAPALLVVEATAAADALPPAAEPVAPALALAVVVELSQPVVVRTWTPTGVQMFWAKAMVAAGARQRRVVVSRERINGQEEGGTDRFGPRRCTSATRSRRGS